MKKADFTQVYLLKLQSNHLVVFKEIFKKFLLCQLMNYIFQQAGCPAGYPAI
jgi:hypothetical protein